MRGKYRVKEMRVGMEIHVKGKKGRWRLKKRKMPAGVSNGEVRDRILRSCRTRVDDPI